MTKLYSSCLSVTDHNWKESFILQFLLMERPKKKSFNIDGIKSILDIFWSIKSIVKCVYYK